MAKFWIAVVALVVGIAAGLGLHWLANRLGTGDTLGLIVAVLLAAMLGSAVAWYMWLRRGSTRGAYAYGASAPADTAQAPRQYSPDKVGNDASARPWERASMAFDAGKYATARTGSAWSGSQSPGIPAGFDATSFVAVARQNFIVLQEAWDRADFATLRAMMTDEMMGEIRAQLADRERQLPGEPNRTDVVMLKAQLLGVEEQGPDFRASVEFSGMIREGESAGPSPFREVWTMTKPRDGATGWLVAGVQALQ